MKLGVLTVPLYDRSVEEAFKYLSGLGVTAVEIGTGGFPGNTHLNPDNCNVDEFKGLLQKYGLTISALSCHGNPVHPNREIAERDNDDFVKTCGLAERLGVDTVVTFSGCPGDYAGAKYPNWVTCAWPTDFLEILKYQWDEVLVPYWNDAVALAERHGVKKIALEMHPGFCVYNPRTLIQLREAVGPSIGANFDPSHLFWQGIKPVEALKALKGAVYHFHAKDTRVDEFNAAINGTLETTRYDDILNRGWVFRTVGYGTGETEWKSIISTLRAIGYDGAISIEHEDALMSVEEGLEKAINFLKPMLMYDKPAEMWWA
ncbi:MAG: sugar phosphate isomerase/epimerase [Clostridiales bacterium]|jgi:sugar phosphate isomerase/epimerase|nr:sugar phosphate isomerase/epimerase [Clostridiales bacterium]